MRPIVRRWLALLLVVAVTTPMLLAEDGEHDNARGVPAEIAALKAQVATLQSQVHALQTQLAAVQSNNALKLGPFVNVDPNPEIGVIGPNIIFSGANIHIVSGSGATNDNGNRTGLGNLIIGYDEDPLAYFGIGFPIQPGDRGGSHDLVIGPANRFTRGAFGGLVAGEGNTIRSEVANVSGGAGNTASGLAACVMGGNGLNTASGSFSVVIGGDSNTASGFGACIMGGGDENTASGEGGTVLGGLRNTASGGRAIVLGGEGNIAGGVDTVVLGGQNVTDNKNISIAPQPPFP